MELRALFPPLVERFDWMLDIYYLPFLFAHGLLYIGLVYTPAYSRWRYLIVASIVACCTVSVRSTLSMSIPGSAGGQYIWGMMMSSSHWLLLAQATYPANNKTPAWKWGLDMLRSARWGVSQKILPKFRSIPSKHQLVISRSWDLLWTLAVLYLVRTYYLYIFEFDFSLVDDGMIHRLGDMTLREWVIRVYITIRGKLEPYLMLRAGHSFFTLVGLWLGDEPAEWPPLFGSISGAYRVRSFYIYFWHHLVRKVFTSHAAFLTNSVLRVPSGTPTSRYMILGLSFTISAIMHIYVEPQTPLRCSVWPQFRYYLSIAAAIILEDLVIAAYKLIRRRRRQATVKAENGNKAKQSVPRIPSPTATTTAVEGEKSTLKKRVEPMTDTGSETAVQMEAKESTDGSIKEATTKASEPVSKPEDEDRFLKIVPWFGYLWVFLFEVWSCSKLLYYQKQCVIPKQYTWEMLLEQLQAGGLEESNVTMPTASD